MIVIPQDATIRLANEGRGWFVSIARPGAPSDIIANMQRPGLAGIITHDPGMSWPDKRGEQLANLTLAQPETAIFLVFADLAGALACRKRLEAGGK